MKTLLIALMFGGGVAFAGVTESLNYEPWRIVNGVTNRTSIKWATFNGRVLQVHPTGVRFEGYYTPLDGGGDYFGEFFVRNFPFDVAEKDIIGTENQQPMVAFPVGSYSYTTVLGASRTIRQLDYGKVWIAPFPKPPTPEQLATAKAAEAKRKSAVAAATLKYNQDQAAAGNAYGQLRMGERYLKGDGVEKDEAKAREYLQKSAAQGNAEAKALLATLK